MTEEQYIERREPEPDGLDFEGLKREGLRLLQELCGKVWTDYNLHDPGVTILENLCYALTDLVYRTGFDVADYLTGKDGEIDYEYQALYRPEEIFPTRPVTVNDYRKLIFDTVPEIDNVWVVPDTDGPIRGLYHIHVRLKDEEDGGRPAVSEKEVCRKIRSRYAENRNLCEDLSDVRVVRQEYYTLRADVEIDNSREPAKVLGEIYFRCAKKVAPGMAFRSFEEMHAEGMSLEEIFTGPRTEHGYIRDRDMAGRTGPVPLSEMIAIIMDVAGVKYVSDIRFGDEQGRETDIMEWDPSLYTVPALRVPTEEGEAGVTLYKSGRKHRIDLRAVQAEFDKRNFEYQALRHTPQDMDRLYTLPQGEFRFLHDYFSVQNHFPDVYGINQHGVPGSEPPRRRAQARQLKAYLMFFEQLMANFLINLKNLHRLFSVDERLKRSYFHQLLGERNMPGAEKLYNREAQEINRKLGRILGAHDNFGDRRNRFLDYLLAIYGEKFTQRSLRHFNYYYTDREMDQALIRNKIRFLKNLREMSRNRAGGFNYEAVSWNTENVSALKQKVSILLDLQYSHNRSLTSVFVEEGLEVISDEQLRRIKEGTVDLEFVDIEDINDRINQRFHEVPDTPSERYDHRRLFDEIVLLRNNLVNASFLRNGIHLNRYRVGSMGWEKKFQVVFRPYDDARWCYLASYHTKKDAVRAVNDLRRFLIDLNAESEGLHLVEHILLRPLSGKDHKMRVPDGFYSCRISVVFPSWSARFYNEKFRMLAEETVRMNCPAHLWPEFYWLDFAEMLEFEILYRDWLTEKCKDGGDAEVLDGMSEKLILFLEEHREKEAAAHPWAEVNPAYTVLSEDELAEILGG